MTNDSTRAKLIDVTTSLVAYRGAADVSMRDVASGAGMAPSAIYHYFSGKDDMLKSMFDTVNTRLGLVRSTLPETATAADMLRQRIEFQLDHAEEIVAVLKYYFAYRNLYEKDKHGVLPEKAYLHMLEVLERGVSSGEMVSDNMVADAQVMTHAVNGFVLEYFPEEMSNTQKQELVDKIYPFLMRAMRGGERE